MMWREWKAGSVRSGELGGEEREEKASGSVRKPPRAWYFTRMKLGANHTSHAGKYIFAAIKLRMHLVN
jgi:hypothetical protein